MTNKYYNYVNEYDLMDGLLLNENYDQSNELIAEQIKYQNLWKSVIAQAVTDSINNYKRTENKLEKIKAMNWILNLSEDFIFVCDLAGCNPYYVKSKIEVFLKNYKNIRS